MATLISQGYVYFGDSSNNMLLYFEECEWDFKFAGAKIKHLAGGGNYGYDDAKLWIEWKFRKIYHTSHANYVTFINYMKAWQQASGITLKVKRDATNFITFNGSDVSYTVLIPDNGMRGNKKLSIGTEDGPYCTEFLMVIQIS